MFPNSFARPADPAENTGIYVGFHAMHDGETPPAGWLERDGSSLLRVGTFAALFAFYGTKYGAADALHFNLPDDRGLFERNWAHGSSRDPDRASRTADTTTGATMAAGDHTGTLQADAFKAHTHTGAVSGLGGVNGGAGNLSDGTTPNTGSTGGNETRPINRARMPIVKY